MAQPIASNYDEWSDMYHGSMTPELNDSHYEFSRGQVAYYIQQLRAINAGEPAVWLPTETAHTFEGYDYYSTRRFIGSISVEEGRLALAWDAHDHSLFAEPVDPMAAIRAVEALAD